MRILIIDDDQDLRKSLKTALTHELCVVDTANDGETGTSLACTNEYDVIILDFNLPKKNGADVCAHIRERGRITPILFLSINTLVETKINALNVGADDYLIKPFSTAELIARLRAITRRGRGTSAQILKIDDVVLDATKQIVHRGKNLVELPRKQYMILEFMMRRPEQVITRQHIMEQIWDMNTDAWSNTVEAHVCELRKRLDTGSRRKLIHTVSGRGYRLALRT